MKRSIFFFLKNRKKNLKIINEIRIRTDFDIYMLISVNSVNSFQQSIQSKMIANYLHTHNTREYTL